MSEISVEFHISFALGDSGTDSYEPPASLKVSDYDGFSEFVLVMGVRVYVWVLVTKAEREVE